MKYSESLPKINFNSTLGDFTISSFYSFYEYDETQINTTTVDVDNRTTLTELSHKIYKDNNSMWLFLIANNTTDPFELLSMNSTLEVNKIQDNINFGLYISLIVQDSNYLQPAGSILVPYSATGGSAWQYTSVGNFDLEGAFGLVDSTDYYSAKMVIKGQTGSQNPFVTTDPEDEETLISIQNDTAGFTCNNVAYTTKEKKPELEDPVIIISTKDNILNPGTSNYPAESFFVPVPNPIPSYGNDGATAIVTEYERILGKEKIINVIPPTSVMTLFGNLKEMSFV